MGFGENQKGNTFAFVTFSPFKSLLGLFSEIFVLRLAHKKQIQTDVRRLEFLHYAHFTRVTPFALFRSGFPFTWRLLRGGFLFNSAYNGDAEVYFRGFSTDLREHMNDLWQSSVDWVDAKPYKHLEKFIQRYQRTVTAHVNAYPSYVNAIRAALEVREEVDRLMDAAETMTDAEFDKVYEDTVMKLWGNAA
jgi:hypothetical protein